MLDQENRWQNSLEELAVFGLGGLSDTSDANGTTAEIGSPLGEKVRATVKGILGARVRASDPKGFRTSLARSFVPHEIHGRVEYKWMPRSYSIEVERGMLTGAQASIHTRATRAVEHSLSLLDGLDALSCECTHEEFDSARAVVRGQLTELVDELGQAGGPRPSRVDVLFAELNSQIDNLEHALHRHEGGTLCSVEDEEIVTNLYIVRDYVQSLQSSWCDSREHFSRTGPERFLGNIHFQLKRHLAVMVESVDEASRIMNRAMFGPRERETVLLEFDGGRDLYLSDLLDWIEHFGGKEALRLLDEGGCYGGQVVKSTLIELADLAERTVHLSCRASDNEKYGNVCAPTAFYSSRVRSALQQVRDHVIQAWCVAEGLPDPPHSCRGDDDPELKQKKARLREGRGTTAASVEYPAEVHKKREKRPDSPFSISDLFTPAVKQTEDRSSRRDAPAKSKKDVPPDLPEAPGDSTRPAAKSAGPSGSGTTAMNGGTDPKSTTDTNTGSKPLKSPDSDGGSEGGGAGYDTPTGELDKPQDQSGNPDEEQNAN